MTPLIHHCRNLFLVCISAWFISVTPGPAGAQKAGDPPQLTDSLYNAHHPRLLFTAGEIPALYAKTSDGGPDDEAYDYIRLAVTSFYPDSSWEGLLGNDYGMETIPNLGLVGFLETPMDTAALALGCSLTLYIADNYDVDSDIYESSLRLRSLAHGYDMFFENSPEPERDYVRNEIIAYIDYMINSGQYGVWEYRPYLGNKSVMAASALGMAAICLDGETDPARITAALDFADRIIKAWRSCQLDEFGAYNEGVVYGAWSIRMLIYYSQARKNYDGVNYSDIPRIRNMEKWFAYELLPEGSGRTNNLNDCAYKDYILSRHNTYFDWAQAEWGSRLSAWIWEHTAGDAGWDWGLEKDNAATVLWSQNLPPDPPENALPRSFLWKNRGLYYYRSGWEMGPGSNDVAFSFYAGEFQGAHAQEDQGQFTLYGYGAKFAVDHGPGLGGQRSQAHNMILIDGVGQHYAGSSIGTDGHVTDYLLSGYADFLAADLADAYATHSKWNNPHIPFYGADWSWGYKNSNPVNYARRTIIAVHDDVLPPYFFLLDDIEKDGLFHQYQWRMHTSDSNTVDTSENPIQIVNGTSRLDFHLLEPAFESVQKSVTSYDNYSEEPDALVLKLSVNDVSPRFGMFLFPADDLVPTPTVSKELRPWGYTLTLDWGGGVFDIFARNTSGGAVTFSPGTAAGTGRAANRHSSLTAAASNDSITTDASLALMRLEGARLIKYLLVDASELSYNDTTWVSVSNGPLSCGLSGGVIQIDRYDADFHFYAPGISEVFYRTQQIHVVSQDGFLTPDPTIGAAEKPRPDFSILARAYPNPFNPTTTVLVELPTRAKVTAAIYNPSGRLVKRLCGNVLPAGTSRLEWNGTNEKGLAVASGVYFLKIQTRGTSRIIKLVLLK